MTRKIRRENNREYLAAHPEMLPLVIENCGPDWDDRPKMVARVLGITKSTALTLPQRRQIRENEFLSLKNEILFDIKNKISKCASSYTRDFGKRANNLTSRAFRAAWNEARALGFSEVAYLHAWMQLKNQNRELA